MDLAFERKGAKFSAAHRPDFRWPLVGLPPINSDASVAFVAPHSDSRPPRPASPSSAGSASSRYLVPRSPSFGQGPSDGRGEIINTACRFAATACRTGFPA